MGTSTSIFSAVSNRRIVTALVLASISASDLHAQEIKAPANGTSDEPAPNTLVAANALITSRNFKGAEDLLRVYLAAEPASGPAHSMLAYALLRQNKPGDSLAEYTRAAALQVLSAEDLRSVGQDYILLGDLLDADKWVSRSIALKPSDPDGWYSLGRLRYTQQRYEDSVECFTHALKLAPESVKAENNLGLAYEGLNRTDDAVKAYESAIEWDDRGSAERRSEQPLLNLAIVQVHRGELDQALPLLQRASAIAPSDPRILEQLGKLYMQENDFTEARESLEAAVRLDPAQSSLHFLLGQTYRHLGRKEEAKREFQLAADLAAHPSQ